MRMTLKELVDAANKELENLPLSETLSKDKRVKQQLTERRVRSYIANGSLHKPIRMGGSIWYDETHLSTLLATRKFLNNGVSDSAIKSFSSMYYQTSDKVDLPENVINSVVNEFELRDTSVDGFLSSDFQEYVDDKAGNNDVVQQNASNKILSKDEENKDSLQKFLSDISSGSTLQSKVNSSLVGSPNPKIVGASAEPVKSVSRGGLFVGASGTPNILGGGSEVATARSGYVLGSGLQAQPLGKSNALESILGQVVTSSRSIQEHQVDDAGKIFLRVEDGANISNPLAVLEKIKQILNIKE